MRIRAAAVWFLLKDVKSLGRAAECAGRGRVAALAAGSKTADAGFRRMKKRDDRLQRQFRALERDTPFGGSILTALRSARYRMLRIPLAIVLVLGGLVGFLPLFGFWMVPVGLLLMAVDIPALRPCVSAAVIRIRRRVHIWRRRWRQWRAG